MSRSRQNRAGGAGPASSSRSKPRARADAQLAPSGDESEPVSAVAADFEAGRVLPRHRHLRAQLVYAVEGVMTVATDEDLWVVPPLRALWVPAGVAHSIRMTGNVAMRTLYFADSIGARASLPQRCAVLHVTPLLRELVVRVVAVAGSGDSVRAHVQRLVELIVDELEAAPVAPLEVPLPVDARLRRITTALLADPSDARDAAAWAKLAGMSERTLARRFPEETGMTLVRWRQQVRLLRALERLAGGEAVTTVAVELGYASTSAFVKLFRENLGVTPARYFAH